MLASLKARVHDRLTRAKLERLRRRKRRFRAARATGARCSANVRRGVNLVAYIRAEMGLGSAARGMAAALDAARIPFNVLNIEAGNYSRHSDHSWLHKEVRHSGYDITVVCVNPDNIVNLAIETPITALADRYVIGYWFWELPELPDDWIAAFEFTDEVWAPSRFVEDAVAVRSLVPVTRIPPVVQLSTEKVLSRADLDLPERRFLFLAMFDANSILQRKNPLGVVRAFKTAFSSADDSVGLVMKINNVDYEQPILRALRKEIADHTTIVIIDRPMTRHEVASLIRMTDCFVSLHHSEGFGLAPAEAMSVGKPSILTNWSGNRDYMTADNCLAIDSELVPLGSDYGPYQAHQRWAEPDLRQATFWMRRIVHEPELATKIGRRAQETINAGFSPLAVGKKIEARLDQIRNAHIVPRDMHDDRD